MSLDILNKIFSNKTKKNDEIDIKEKTAQQWIPIADIDKGIIYRKDDSLVGIMRIQPENLELLSDREKKKIVDSLAEGYNGENESFQIFCIGRPVDLNNYLDWLDNKAKMEQDFKRKMLLKSYIQQASDLASSGETTERRFYLIISKKNSKKAEVELAQRLSEFSRNLQQAELSTKICEEDELLDVLSLFANPIQASFERVESKLDLPPIIKNKE